MGNSRTHPMVRINYAIRAGSFAYCFLVLGIHGWERGWGVPFWAALAAQFLVYPHLAYWHARSAALPKRAEEINLYVDAGLLGAWIAALQFPVWPAYAAFFSTALNAAVVFGVLGSLWTMACFSAGAAVGVAGAALALNGAYFPPAATSGVVTGLCFFGSLAYSCWIGWVAHRLRQRIRAGSEAWRASEARYRLLAENATDLVGLVDQDGRWLYASPSYGKVLDAADLETGADAFRRVHPEDADVARAALLRAAATGKPRELTLRLVDREGRVRHCNTHVQPVNGERPATRLVLVTRGEGPMARNGTNGAR